MNRFAGPTCLADLDYRKQEDPRQMELPLGTATTVAADPLPFCQSAAAQQAAATQSPYGGLGGVHSRPLPAPYQAPRKIIQITATSTNGDTLVLGLCNDGSVYQISRGDPTWSPLPALPSN